MTASSLQVSPQWLRLREGADAAARSPDLVDQVQAHLPGVGPVVIHDLGCGTGSMRRWLSPRLSGPQHWIMHDRDADLLALAAADLPSLAADDAPVTAQTRHGDITRLDAGDLAGAGLITASALLDMMTADELERFVTTSAAAGCPALVTLSVVGRVDLTPPDPLDAQIASAFNAHQRRITADRRLLGPEALAAAVEAFIRRGADVVVRPSPWALGAAQAALAAQWFTGWVGAACEQDPELAAGAAAYARRRLAEARAGRLGVRVHHCDLLALSR